MGCDIHGWVERKWKGKWVAVHEFNEHARERNYLRFAALAGVRGDGPEPRGWPSDASDTAAYHAEGWEGDAHSHSWLPMAEAVPLFAEVRYKHGEERTEYMKKWPASHWFGVHPDEGGNLDDFRIVFYFDN